MNVICLWPQTGFSSVCLCDHVSVQLPLNSKLSHNLQADCHPTYQHGLHLAANALILESQWMCKYEHTHTQGITCTNIPSLKVLHELLSSFLLCSCSNMRDATVAMFKFNKSSKLHGCKPSLHNNITCLGNSWRPMCCFGSAETTDVVVLLGRTVTICCLKDKQDWDDIGGGKNNFQKGCVVEHKYKLVQGQQKTVKELWNAQKTYIFFISFYIWTIGWHGGVFACSPRLPPTF